MLIQCTLYLAAYLRRSTYEIIIGDRSVTDMHRGLNRDYLLACHRWLEQTGRTPGQMGAQES